MTAPATPAAPVPYSALGTVRPTPVTTIATLGVIFGTFGLLCKPAGLVMQLFLKLPQPNPVFDAFRNDPALRAWTIAAGITGTLVSLLLLLSSLGSLQLKQWARLGMLSYASLAALLTVVGQLFAYFVVGPAVVQAMRQAGLPNTQPNWLSGPIGMAIGLVVGLWFPLLIVLYYNRRDVKQAFALGLAKADI